MEGLEEQRGKLIGEIARLRDFRAGSITAFTRRCGKAGCRCACEGNPGHGPTKRLTYKVGGKTMTESLPDRAAIKKAEAEIAEFRRFQELSRKLIEVNLKICGLRTAEGQGEISKKNSKRRSSRKSVRK